MKVLFVSLGCDKNLVDSEMMLGMLAAEGYSITDDEREADIIIVNTCCFIGDAKEESIETIIELGRLKEEGQCKLLVAAGCLAQRYHEEIQAELPEVDLIIGTTAYENLPQTLNAALEGTCKEQLADIDYLPEVGAERVHTTGGYYAYIKIAEGCDKCCTYCIIPKVRGHYRSIPMEKLTEQAEKLVQKGVKEIILVAQETTLYGVDLYGKKALPQLLQKLAEIPGLHWIRILYCYPEEITEELLQVMAKEPKICKYLDIPIQHGSDDVLKRMGRRTTQADLREKISRIREMVPEIALRTTLITGFPGETEKDHQEQLRFVQDMKFDRLGVFTYSQEEDTPAAQMPDQIPEEVKQARRDDVMELQQRIAFEKAEDTIGTQMYAIVEGKLPEEGVFIARTYRDAPDVDGYVFIRTEKEFMSGDFVKIHVTGAQGYDLIGEQYE